MKREDIIKELELYLDEGTNHNISFNAVRSILDILKNENNSVVEVVKDYHNYIRFSCDNCRSQLKVNKKNIKLKYDKGYTIAKVECPCCGSINTITN